MLLIYEFHVHSSHVYQMCKNQFNERMWAAGCLCENHGLHVNTEECSNMSRRCIHIRRDLYLDAKGSGL